jgi:MFS family permease
MTIVKGSSLRDKIVEFLGLKKSMVALMAIVILIGLGEKMAERFLPILLLALGGGFLSVGFLNGLDNLLSALYSFPSGYLSDKVGHKKALLVFNLIALFGYAIVILFPYWPAVFVGAVFFLSWRCRRSSVWSPRFCPSTKAPWAYPCTRWCVGYRWLRVP